MKEYADEQIDGTVYISVCIFIYFFTYRREHSLEIQIEINRQKIINTDMNEWIDRYG